LKDQRRDKGLAGSEPVAAYLAEKLSAAASVIVEIFVRSTAVRACDSGIDRNTATAANRLDWFSEQAEMLLQERLEIELLKLADDGRLVYGKALVLRTLEVVGRLSRGKLIDNDQKFLNLCY
jgi:hypothetical protein